MTVFEWTLIVVGSLGVLAYKRASLAVWTFVYFLMLYVLTRSAHLSAEMLVFLWVISILFATVLNVQAVRKRLFSQFILKSFRKNQPKISTTEKEALEAGTVVWDRDLFSGKPSWQKLTSQHLSQLTEDEKAFLAGPVVQLCHMLTEWDISYNITNFPKEVWDFIKQNGFLALSMPIMYGGKGFSAYACACILGKITSKLPTLSSVVAVPNSLGPAELILEYGTEAQKEYYLPRLAKGEDLPCFALTGPDVGSDASSMPDKGIVCKGIYQGKETVGIRLNWNKRYITLGPIATLLGLAFKLEDPDHLLGDKVDVGITCALIPTDLPGITIGRRHYAGSLCFINGPNQGKDVFVPLDNIIGGAKMAGRGWRMLVECLSSGRAISLPGSVLGGMKSLLSYTTAYCNIRRQFNLSIGKFEGIQERIARMACFTFISDATTHLTASYVDHGERPSILSAIVKYHTTEFSRKLILDAMDIHAGRGICMGKNNYLTSTYFSTPIPITVEGSNILVRCLIIFGQGAVRCHPYLYQEMLAAENPDTEEGLLHFDKAVFAHLGLTISNCVRVFALAFSTLAISLFPTNNKAKREFQLFSRYSAVLAFLTDMSLFLLRDKLKRREKISARLGDILSMLYMGSAVLRKYKEMGCKPEFWPIIQWSCEYLRYMIQEQTNNAIDNLAGNTVRRVLSFLVFPLGRRQKYPRDNLSHAVAKLVLVPGEVRNSLLKGIYSSENDMSGKMEKTFIKMVEMEPLIKKLEKIDKGQNKAKGDFSILLELGLSSGIITQEENKELKALMADVNELIAVEDFDPKDFNGLLKAKESASTVNGV